MAAQQTIFGWQLGVSETVGTALTTDRLQFVQLNPLFPGDTLVEPGYRSTGLQLNTQATANLTLDIIGNTLEHGFLAGIGLTDLRPTLLREDAAQALRNATLSWQANGRYLMRLNRGRWGAQLGVDYGYSSAAQAFVQNGAATEGNTTLPGTVIADQRTPATNIDSHTLGARGLYQLTRQRWDLDISGNYNYSSNALVNLAATDPNVPTADAQRLLTTSHNLSPALNYRQRIGARHQINTGLLHSWTIPVRPDPDPEQPILAVGLPETTQSTANLQYLYNTRVEQSFGLQGAATFTMRVPTSNALDRLGLPQIDAEGNERGLIPDTFFYQVQGVYSDELRWAEARVTLSAGIGQARLYQPPLGQAGENENEFSYENAVVSNIEAIGNLAIDRRFDPIDVQLTLGRNVGVGGLGASAVVTENAGLNFRYALDLSAETVIQMTAGVNAARTRGVGAEFLPPAPSRQGGGTVFAATNNNTSFGAGGGAQMPLLREGGFLFDANLTYNYLYTSREPINEDDDGETGIHAVFLAIRGTWGRGPLDAIDETQGELDAFSANPATGSPLTSARLLNQRQALNEGTRGRAPGLPAEGRRDSQQGYQAGLQAAAAGRAERIRAGSEMGEGSVAQEEAAAQERMQSMPPPEPQRRPTFEEIPPEDLVVPLVKGSTTAATPVPPSVKPVKPSVPGPAAPAAAEPEDVEVDEEGEPEDSASGKKAGKKETKKKRGKKAVRKKKKPAASSESEIERF